MADPELSAVYKEILACGLSQVFRKLRASGFADNGTGFDWKHVWRPIVGHASIETIDRDTFDTLLIKTGKLSKFNDAHKNLRRLLWKRLEKLAKQAEPSHLQPDLVDFSKLMGEVTKAVGGGGGRRRGGASRKAQTVTVATKTVQAEQEQSGLEILDHDQKEKLVKFLEM
eukprot:SAG11_NODE_12994_length_675_cov_1.171875_1_plen_169_part_01